MAGQRELAIEIGSVPIVLRTSDRAFQEMLEDRYAGFLCTSRPGRVRFEIDLIAESSEARSDEDLEVAAENGRWRLKRGDFLAEWDSQSGRGSVRQPPNRYAIDAVLRIVHTMILAEEGGFLLHAASAVRNGKAFVFTGVSGAGKTTLSRLAPADATLLTDEISYIRREGGAYRACGTPFSGELQSAGENISAPIGALFLLAKGTENRVEPLQDADALRSLLRNILFFAKDPELVKRVFQSACEFVRSVPVHRLTFFPDERVWSVIS